MSSFKKFFEVEESDGTNQVREFSMPSFEMSEDHTKLVAFNFKQFGQPEEEPEVVEEIDPHQVAQEIIQQAQENAAQIEKEALEQGQAQGYQAGREAGEKSLAEAIQQLKASIAALESQKQELFRRREQDLLNLLLIMARKVIESEISLRPEITSDIIKSSYQYLTGTEGVRLRLNPQVQEWLENHRDPWDEQLAWLNNVEIIADGQISVGGLILETASGDIDRTLETRWQGVAQVIEEALHRDRSSGEDFEF